MIQVTVAKLELMCVYSARRMYDRQTKLQSQLASVGLAQARPNKVTFIGGDRFGG